VTIQADIAVEIARLLNVAEIEAGPHEDFIWVPKWKLRTWVVVTQHENRPGVCLVHVTLNLEHPDLPRGGAREMVIGYADTQERAVQVLARNAVTYFYLPLSFVFDPQTHSCFVNQEPFIVDRAPMLPQTAFLGPIQLAHPVDLNPEFGDDVLWQALSQPLQKHLAPGVHHIRCYAARLHTDTENSVIADVFIDGIEWPHGTQILKELAKSLPDPGLDARLISLKQHAFIRSDDPVAGRDRAERCFLADGLMALSDRPDLAAHEDCNHILLALQITARSENIDQLRAFMLSKGIPALHAQRLSLFLPTIAFWQVYPLQCIRPLSYYWTNSNTKRCTEIRFDQTPLFLTASAIIQELHKKDVANEEISLTAKSSSEYNSVEDRLEGHQKFDAIPELNGARFMPPTYYTDESVHGEFAHVLLERAIALHQIEQTFEHPGASSPPPKATHVPPAPPPSPRPWWKVW
jgi:hypothetical protein